MNGSICRSKKRAPIRRPFFVQQNFYMASLPRSPVRIRIHSSSGVMNIFPVTNSAFIAMFGRINDGANGGINKRIVDSDFNFYFSDQVWCHGLASIDLGLFLASMAIDPCCGNATNFGRN